MVHTNCDGGGGAILSVGRGYRLGGGGYRYTYRCVYIGVWAPIHEYFFSDSRAVKDGAIACGTDWVVFTWGGGYIGLCRGGGGTVPRRRHRGRPPPPHPSQVLLSHRGWPGPPPTPKCTTPFWLQHYPGSHEHLLPHLAIKRPFLIHNTGCFFAWIGVVGCFFFGRTCDRWVVRNKQMEISLVLREKMALTSSFIFGVQSVICILFE